MSQACESAPLRDHQLALCTLLAEFDRVCAQLKIPYLLFAGTLLGAVRHGGFIPWDDDLDVLMLREDYERFLREAEGVLDREKFFLQKEFSPHWPLFFSKLRLNNTTCLEKFHPRDDRMHQGVYMDIFPCDNALSSGFGRKCQYLCSKVVIAKALDRRGYDTDSVAKKAFMALCRFLPLEPFARFARRGKPGGEWVHTFFGAASSYEKNIYPRQWFEGRCPVKFEAGEYPAPEAWDALLTKLYGEYMQLPPPEARAVKQHALLVDLERSWEHYAHYRDGMVFAVRTRSIR